MSDDDIKPMRAADWYALGALACREMMRLWGEGDEQGRNRYSALQDACCKRGEALEQGRVVP